MKKVLSEQTQWRMEGDSFVCLCSGLIAVSDEVNGKKEEIQLWVGTDSLNDAINSSFAFCDRATQERFIQTLTAHIRKEDNVEA